MFSDAFLDLIQIFRYTGIFFIRGGWVLFVLGFIYIFYKLYRSEIEHQFLHSQEWVFLSIKVPKENTVSTLAIENMFSQMHALYAGLTFPQTYIEGRIQLWYSMEIVSMGGRISFIIRLPKAMRNLVEAAVYSNYPEAEISEVGDYMENLDYDPDSSDFDIWGAEWKLEADDVIPIKTYKDFEHPTAEEKIIDPLGQHFEALAKMEPHEFYGVQIIIQPLADEFWKPRGEAKVKELIGEEVPHRLKFTDILFAPVNWFANFSFLEALTGGGHNHGHDEENKQKNNWMQLTDVEKERVGAIQRKIGKPGYKTKIRHLYIAPKDKFDSTKKSVIIGSYRPLGSAMTNKLKPDTSKTWTSLEYKISPGLEKPYMDWESKRRKRLVFKGYKNRDIHIGLPMPVLNAEELATLYHFPITTETRPVPSFIDASASRRAQPPADLPVPE